MDDEITDVHGLHRRYPTLPVSFWYAKAEAGEIPSFKLGRKYRRFEGVRDRGLD